jgi:ferredoxin-type protein NapH
MIDEKHTVKFGTQGRFWRSLWATLPMALILFVMLSGGPVAFASPERLFALVVVWGVFVFLFFRMMFDGATDRWRAPVFVAFALALSFVFIIHMFEIRGTQSYSNSDILECQTPFCHIVTTMMVIPMALAKSIIFPGRIEGGFAPISEMLVIVFGSLIVLGRGFCAWGCFYGGWDDGFSRIRKRAWWKSPPTYLRFGGFAVLILVALTSAAALEPTYCDWVCPFKAVTEYEALEGFMSYVRFAIFASLFLALVVVIPLVSKKRSQCAWFCPMGAFSALFSKVNPVDVRIDKDKCLRCGKCVKICPMDALADDALSKGRADLMCSKCGKCIDNCPTGAIGYHIRLTKVGAHPTAARLLFLYAAFLFLATFSGGSFQQAIVYLIKFIATGSVLS